MNLNFWKRKSRLTEGFEESLELGTFSLDTNKVREIAEREWRIKSPILFYLDYDLYYSPDKKMPIPNRVRGMFNANFTYFDDDDGQASVCGLISLKTGRCIISTLTTLAHEFQHCVQMEDMIGTSKYSTFQDFAEIWSDALPSYVDSELCLEGYTNHWGEIEARKTADEKYKLLLEAVK